MKNYFNFENSNVLILGASSGFGKIYSETFYDLGANVISVARNYSKLKKIKSECEYRNKNGSINVFKCDVNSEKDVNQLIKKIKKQYRQLNIVIYCCGCNVRQLFVDIQPQDFNYVMKTNYFSAFNLFKKIYPMLKNSKYARIINLTSIFSTKTMQKRTAYSASKAALLMLTKSLALEWCGKNFTVNSISPGPFLTEINLPVLKNKKEYKKMCQKIPLNRFGNVDEIITPMLFLASPNSSYVNGSEIIVDGGWSIL
jgi:meso-butanediol dehydrogenase/(S,S)-butanediol dehydrogenase/diacetyl reductase